jgi:hypothetical protein
MNNQSTMSLSTTNTFLLVTRNNAIKPYGSLSMFQTQADITVPMATDMMQPGVKNKHHTNVLPKKMESVIPLGIGTLGRQI